MSPYVKNKSSMTARAFIAACFIGRLSGSSECGGGVAYRASIYFHTALSLPRSPDMHAVQCTLAAHIHKGERERDIVLSSQDIQ